MLLRFTIPWIAVLLAGALAANEMHLAATPILNASLPPGSTWQVESSTAGGPWTASGVLIAGAATPVSVRLDGYAVDADYRFLRHDTKATVPAAISRGLHLAGFEPNRKPVAITVSSDLGAWSPAGVVMPANDGSYVRAIREPFAGRAFFRSKVPATQLTQASVTSYPSDPATGTSGFGPVADDMPAIYQQNRIAAVAAAEFNRGGINAAASGECYELAGPAGKTTVMIGDLATTPPAGTVDVGRGFLDLSAVAFGEVAGSAALGTVTRRLVPAPVTGNVKLLVVTNAGGFYTELRPYNHRAGINTLEIRQNGSGTWTALPRTSYNSFVHSGAALSFPVAVRVTSRFGEAVEFPALGSMAGGQRITGPAQFTAFPELAPEPVWMMAPVYEDSFSNVLGDSWSASGYSGASVQPAAAAAAYLGSAGIEITALGGFNGVNFLHSSAVPKPDYGVMTFALRCSTTASATALGLQFDGAGPGGSAVSSAMIRLPEVTAAWQVFWIPLRNSDIPASITGFRLVSLAAGAEPTLWMDEISLVPH
jgi:expansin (peptidoglycan-binding protein)